MARLADLYKKDVAPALMKKFAEALMLYLINQ